jgi:hypothetical protein
MEMLPVVKDLVVFIAPYATFLSLLFFFERFYRKPNHLIVLFGIPNI